MKDLPTPKGFLTIGGIFLLLLAILGFAGFRLGSNGSLLNFDTSESIAHLFLGIVALVLVMFLKNNLLNKWVTVSIGVLGVAAAIIGFSHFMNSTILGAHFESPIDNIFNLVIGVWGLYAGLMAKQT